MIQQFIQKTIQLLIKPNQPFKAAANETLRGASGYYLTLLIINTIVTMTLIGVQIIWPMHPFDPLWIGIVYAVLLTCVIGFTGLVLHGAVYLAGGRHGIMKTFMVDLYGSTPFLMTSWIALLLSWFGPFGLYGMSIFELYFVVIFFWTIYVAGIGIQELHGISPIRSYLAVGGSLIVSFFIMLIALIIGFAILWSLGPMYTLPQK